MDLPHADLTGKIIGAALTVHSHLGPGLLESAYETCLAIELTRRGIRHQRQLSVPIRYADGTLIENAFRVDMLVEELCVVEVKSVASVLPVHESQLVTYLKLLECPVGLLINFNTTRLRDGITRKVWMPASPP